MNSKLLPLAVLDAYERTDEHLDGFTPFTKMVFLTQRRAEGPTCYTFETGNYGPVSRDLYNDVHRLHGQNFIELTTIEKSAPVPGVTSASIRYELTPKGRRALEAGTMDADAFEYNLLAIQQTVSTYAELSPYALLEAVYRVAPELFQNDQFLTTTPNSQPRQTP